MEVDENQFDNGLDEILFMAFVGHYTRDENGDFVSLDDKYNVLKDHLRKELTEWRDKEVVKARKQTIIDATGGMGFEMPMRSMRTRNTAFKKYAVKYFNTKIRERRDRMLAAISDTESNKEGINNG